MKKHALVKILVFATIFVFGMASIGSAGNVQRNRWEGVAIGLGAAVLAGSIIQAFNRPTAPPAPAPAPNYRHHTPPPATSYYTPPPRRARGHWEMRDVWVPPVQEKVWNPAHYNRHGKWVPGRWMMVERQAGYWKKDRVWVAGGYGRR